MTQFAPGQLVVCTRTNDPKYSYLVHAVGEVRQVLPKLLAMILSSDYEVFFPLYAELPCPNCGKNHKGSYAMAHNELKPLEDPDKGKVEDHDKELSPEFGFST